MADQSTNAGSAFKKRARTVSNLTDEQIQHKRNVDRRAQRAFRQRTKDCITNLEQQFTELQETCSHKDRELQALRADKLRLIDYVKSVVDLTTSLVDEMSETSRENQLALNLGHLVDATQLLVSQHHLETAQAEEHHDTQHSRTQQQSESESEDRMPERSSEPEKTPTQVPESRHSQLPSTGGPSQDVQHESALLHLGDTSNITASQQGRHSRLWERTTVVADAVPSGATVGDSYSTPASENYHHSGPTISSTDEHFARSQFSAPADDISHDAPMVVFPTPTSTITAYDRHHVKPKAAHAVLASHVHPTCPLDEILLDFIHTRRDLIANGAAAETTIGPPKPTVKAMVDPSLIPSVHPLSGVVSGIFSTFPHVGRAEKLGFFFKMCLTLRWQISPTRENYNAIPAWLRPTVTQVTVPHACWIDNIPWPGVRDILIEKADEYPFHVFSDYYSQNVTVNWQYDSLDAISDVDGDCVLHSIFEKHVRNIKNWTVSPDFTARFPDMASAIYSRE